MKKILVTLLFAFASAAHCFEVREFAPPKSFWPSSNTVTLSYTQPKSTGVIIFFPGGDGQIPIPKQPQEPRGYGIILKAVVEQTGFDAVVVNSPYSLETPGQSYPGLRESNDHLERLETIVKYYHNNRKVWLVGHSNGSFSAVELMR